MSIRQDKDSGLMQASNMYNGVIKNISGNGWRLPVNYLFKLGLSERKYYV